MKKTSGFTKALGLATAAMLAIPAYAATEVLTLTVTGTILSTPDWQDGSSASIASVAFDFDGLVAGAAAANVDSAASTVKLVNATAYPATVALVRPATCTIGADNVANGDVHFLNNGTPVTTDTNISLATNGDQSYALRFAAAGNYGDKSGAVACAVSGSLTYTY